MICSGRFERKVVVVTGGGSGIGEAICRRVAAEGGIAAILDVDLENARRVADSIGENQGIGVAYNVDVTDAAAITDVIRRVVADHGTLDAAVNNAGVGGPFIGTVDYPLDWWERILAVNISGVFYSLRAELPTMLANGRGSIVNIASICGVVGDPGLAGYVASKHAVVGLTKTVALEYGRQGIRVNAVGPTYVRTPLASVGISDEASWTEHDERHATGRCATADEVAALVAYLASDDAGSITGSLHLVDGGITAQ